VNLALFDEWQSEPLFIEDCVRFLDNVLQFFIDMAPHGLHKAVYSATQERAIGLGMLGWHTLLQRRSIAWESGGYGSAIQLCHQTAKHIKQRAVAASEKLAGERGEAPDMIGTGRRNSHLLAVAPNANSGIIAGVSASIEPIRANCYTHRTRAGSFLVKNSELERVLLGYDQDSEWLAEQWSSIMQRGGSVQHLGYLSDHERAVFKTALELDQNWVVEHARIRQEHICQGQSVNLFFPAGTSKIYFNSVHLSAFKEEGSGAPLKGLYYCRTEAKQKADQVSVKVERKALADYETQANEDGDCLSCQG
jgi:ribonucleoside-diphosphate reductase alpha chain